MTFLAILLALVLLQFWGSGGPLQRDAWFGAWVARLGHRGLAGGLGLALAVLVPALLAAWVFEALEGVLFGLFWVLAAAAVLLYGFGRGDLDELTARYRDHCRRGDFQGAWYDLSAALALADPLPPDSAADVHRRLQRAFYYEGCQRWFAPILYFLLFGPAGALAYRLLHLCRGRFDEGLLERCLFLADWLPGRLLAATFTVAGNFVASRDALLSGLGEGSLATDALLYRVGEAALDPDAEGDGAALEARCAARNGSLRALLSRSAVCWVAVIALVVLLD